jgi:hypothetical protein
MARTSKIALAVAAALAVAVVVAGTAFAAAHGSAAVGTRVQTAYAGAQSPESAPGGDGQSERTGGRDEGHWRGDASRANSAGLMRGFRDEDHFAAGEILQWVAIGLLGGAAIALAVWRPWRPTRAGAGVSGGAVPAPIGPVSPETGPGPGSQHAQAAAAEHSPAEAVTFAQGPPESAAATQPSAGRPRHWLKHREA